MGDALSFRKENGFSVFENIASRSVFDYYILRFVDAILNVCSAFLWMRQLFRTVSFIDEFPLDGEFCRHRFGSADLCLR